MEALIFIIFIGFIFLFIKYCCYMAKKSSDKYNNRIFINSKNQRKYHVEKIINSISSGEEHKIVLYKDIESKKFYLLNYIDFLKEFKSINEL